MLDPQLIHQGVLQDIDFSYYNELNRTAPVPQFTPEQRHQLKIDHDLEMMLDAVPQATPAEALAAYELADQINRYAQDQGERFWKKQISAEDVEKEIQLRFPGLLPETYKKAAHRGIWAAMW